MVPAREFRVVLVVDDYVAARTLYRDVLGLDVLMDLEADGGNGVILRLPEATLELADAEHGRIVDDIEVGRATGARVRVAVRVDDLAAAASQVAAAGSPAVAPPVVAPWGDLVQRLDGAGGVQLTLFQTAGPTA